MYIGAGVLVNPKVFLNEVKMTRSEGRVWVDYNASIIEEKHINFDKTDEYLSKIVQTTGTGCGPAMVDRVRRVAKLAKDEPRLAEYLDDVSERLNEAIDKGQRVLIEGTQGTFLSLYHGTYPYVTSKDVTAGTLCSDVGIGPTVVDDVIIVFKAYLTRVGGGPLENEIPFEEAKKRGWDEYGTVTGRPRRIAPFNFKLAKKAVKLNGATQAAVTKIDRVYPSASGVKDYRKLPEDAKKFIDEIESEIGIPVTIISTGPEVEETIDIRKEKSKR